MFDPSKQGRSTPLRPVKSLFRPVRLPPKTQTETTGQSRATQRSGTASQPLHGRVSLRRKAKDAVSKQINRAIVQLQDTTKLIMQLLGHIPLHRIPSLRRCEGQMRNPLCK
eukprot:11569840-Prorocentrum_lima.AAC.1